MNEKELNQIKNILSSILKIPEIEITECSIKGGMTNHNYLFQCSKGRYIVRIPGEGTNEFINREEEKEHTYNAVKAGWHPEVIYFDDYGIKITKYIENSEILNSEFLKNESILRNIISILKTLHTGKIKSRKELWIYNEYKKYNMMLQKDKVDWNLYPEFEVLDNNFKNLVEKLKSLNDEFSLCHNDLVPQNWIISKGNLYLLDWEYSSVNDPAFDIAGLFSEFNLEKSIREDFLKIYCNGNNTNFLERVYIYELLQHVLWFVWTLVKEQHGVFFGSYGENRLKKAFSLWSKYK